MTARYQIRHYTTGGVQDALFTTWRSLTYRKRLNDFGTYTFTIDGKSSNTEVFALDSFFEVQRRDQDAGLQWYTDFIGMHRTSQFQTTESGLELFTSYGRTLEDLLRRRAIAYKSGAAMYSGPAETVMKDIVRLNCGQDANHPSRIRDGRILGFNVVPDTGFGPQWEGSRAYRNVLDILKEVSDATGVDFSLEINTYASGFLFYTYYPYRGVDRRIGTPVPHIFAVDRGNLKRPSYTHSRTEEVTVAIVAGQGLGGARIIAIAEADARLDSPWNDIETVRDARNESTVDALADVASAELVGQAARENLVFEVVQTNASVYGRDYNLGDFVTVQYRNIQRDKRIVGVSVTVSEGEERIVLEFGDGPWVPRTPEELLAHAVRVLAQKVARIEHSGDI